jgi:hypothetical protein
LGRFGGGDSLDTGIALVLHSGVDGRRDKGRRSDSVDTCSDLLY